MRNIILLVIFVLGIVFAEFTSAQTADEIINKYIEARGGKDKLNSVKSLYMEGSRQMMGNEVPVKVTIVQDKLYRADFEFAGNTGYTIVTPTAGWSFIPMRSQKPDPIPEDRLKNMQGQMDIAGSLVDYAAKGNKVELLGKEAVDGVDAYKIKLTLPGGRNVTYYIDAKTNLLIQSKQMGAPGRDGTTQEMITTYSDYKTVDGILFPHTISNPGQGGMSGSTTFDKVEVNKPVAEDQYKPGK